MTERKRHWIHRRRRQSTKLCRQIPRDALDTLERKNSIRIEGIKRRKLGPYTTQRIHRRIKVDHGAPVMIVASQRWTRRARVADRTVNGADATPPAVRKRGPRRIIIRLFCARLASQLFDFL